MENEKEYVWVFHEKGTIEVFAGFDHERRTTKSYKSIDNTKMLKLANDIAKSRKTTIFKAFT